MDELPAYPSDLLSASRRAESFDVRYSFACSFSRFDFSVFCCGVKSDEIDQIEFPFSCPLPFTRAWIAAPRSASLGGGFGFSGGAQAFSVTPVTACDAICFPMVRGIL
jgi:hypothetical protein